eukprot:TRINITY_DN11759_c0_g1_i1.p1 TRINITY_DN11759_c0_g1~~TRINITY_DN11759_c0_g1_i1.p1  ORF type:complete len:412 (-),score=33.94 TRINITY_DN11759_c0_g1_i1:143-1282(-)
MEPGRITCLFSLYLVMSRAAKQWKEEGGAEKWYTVQRSEEGNKIKWQLLNGDNQPVEHYHASYSLEPKGGELQISTRTHAGTFSRPRRVQENKLHQVLYSVVGDYVPNEQEDMKIEVNMREKSQKSSRASKLRMHIVKKQGEYTAVIRILSSSGELFFQTTYKKTRKIFTTECADKMGPVSAALQKKKDINQWWIAAYSDGFDADTAKFDPNRWYLPDGPLLGPLSALFAFVVAQDWLHELQNEGPCSKYETTCFVQRQFNPERCTQTESKLKMGSFLGQFCWLKQKQQCEKTTGPHCEYYDDGTLSACHNSKCSYDGPCRSHGEKCLTTDKELDEKQCSHQWAGPLQMCYEGASLEAESVEKAEFFVRNVAFTITTVE